MTAIHTAAFYFGWAILVVVAFFVVDLVRTVAGAVGSFWTTYVSPLVTDCNRLMDRFSGTLLLTGLALTVFGALVCASSTRWLAITDTRSLIVGLVTLAIGMAATLRANRL
jgi:hypothetical protein